MNLGYLNLIPLLLTIAFSAVINLTFEFMVRNIKDIKYNNVSHI